MKQNQTKSENRKALPVFLLIVVLALVAGFALGFLAVSSDDSNWQQTLREALSWFFANTTPFILLALFAGILTVGLRTVSRGKKMIAALGDDDESFRAADHLLGHGLNAVNTMFIPSYFFAGALMCYIPKIQQPLFWLGLGSFCGILAAEVIFSQKLVDLTKKLYPEKQGSVYDVKFNKIWLSSCDEAERAVIAQAALSGYHAATSACLALWLLFVLMHMFFDTGLLPIFAVSVVWFVSFLSYTRRAAKLEKTGVR